jgi:Asp-tRNA(Asn)/Glu-tRNA(Gln) amidotransferase A subunit family amidase
MQAIARPDGRDMSVSDIPFNWNASVDMRKLRVGIIQESFDNITDLEAKARNQKVLDILSSLGISDFTPLSIPDNPLINIGGPERAAYFDELVRAGKMIGSRGTNGGGAGSRLISAVEYLQSQRTRTMMMMELARATQGVDVYVVAGGGGGGGRGAAGSAITPAVDDAAVPASGRDGRGGGRGGNAGGVSVGGAAGHSNMANLACYPAMNVPNGFNASGSPTNCTVFGRPFNETEVIALVKAYQDVAGYHLMKPTRIDS